MLQKSSVRILFAIAALALLPSLLNAQFNATLQGTVSDQSGAVIGNAKLTLTNHETQQKQTTQTSNDGFYRFPQLGPGTYTLTAESNGFSKQVLQNVTVSAEQTQGRGHQWGA